MNAAAHQVIRPAAAGWFGKLPGLGDFACRRLPSRFTDGWDAWLQRAIGDTRERLREDWSDLFTTFPVWRFVLPPDLLGPDGWSGILLPSVDRVGRCFPLTVAFELDGRTFERFSLVALEACLEALTHAALQALESDDAEAFDKRLVEVPLPLPNPAPVLPLAGQAMGPSVTLSYRHAIGDLLARSASQRLLSTLSRRTVWWVTPGSDAPGLAFVADALDTLTFERILHAREEHEPA